MPPIYFISLCFLVSSSNWAFAGAGGAAEGFNFSHWEERLHIFWLSFCVMTGGSIIYGFLLRKKRKNDVDDT